MAKQITVTKLPNLTVSVGGKKLDVVPGSAEMTTVEDVPDDSDRKAQAYMRRAVAELQRVHRLSERDAASIMLTVTSVVSLGPKSAK